MKKNLVFKIIALVSVLLMVLAIILNNAASLPLALVGATALFVLGIILWIVPAKKCVLFRIITLSAAYLLVLSWIIPASSVTGMEAANIGLYRMGLYSILEYPYLGIQYFTQQLLFILAVGAFYGVLTETGKYRNLLEKIAKSMKGKELVFLGIVTFILAALSSVFGLNLLLFVFIPAICTLVLLMGYDKITAFLVGFIAPLIGTIGNTYGTSIVGYINQALGTDYTTNLLAKIGLFVLSFAVYFLFLSKYASKNKSKANELSEKLELVLLGEKKNTKKPVWPLLVVFGLLFVLIVIGQTDWASVFNTTIFTDLHSSITTWEIGDHTIVAYLIDGLDALGSWYLKEFTIMLVLASIVLSLVYNLKLEDALKAMSKGAEKTLKPGLLVVLAYVIVIITAYHPFLVTITDAMVGLVSSVSGFFGSVLFVIVSVLNTILSTALNIDMLYVVSATTLYLGTQFSSFTSSLAIITQALYGLTLFVAPTSTMLILGLEYLNIPYREWLKNAWKLVVALLAIIVIVIVVVMLVA